MPPCTAWRVWGIGSLFSASARAVRSSISAGIPAIPGTRSCRAAVARSGGRRTARKEALSLIDSCYFTFIRRKPYVLLGVLDGQLEPLEGLSVARLPHFIRIDRVIEERLQLVRRPNVVEQRRGERLALLFQLLEKAHDAKVSDPLYLESFPPLTVYSALNSASIVAKRRSSLLSSKAVRMGSLLDRAIRDGEASAR